MELLVAPVEHITFDFEVTRNAVFVRLIIHLLLPGGFVPAARSPASSLPRDGQERGGRVRVLRSPVLTPGSGFGYFVPHEVYKMWARENGDILKISQDKPSLLGEHKCLDSQRVIITSESEF